MLLFPHEVQAAGLAARSMVVRRRRWRARCEACALALWLTASLVAEHASGQVVKTVAGACDRLGACDKTGACPLCRAGSDDGAGTYARFNYPTGLAVAPAVDGEGLIIYVADKLNGASAPASRWSRRTAASDSAARVAALTARPWCAALCRAGPHSCRHDGGQLDCRPPLDGLHTRRTHQRHLGLPHR
jgi:hypothetical protein